MTISSEATGPRAPTRAPRALWALWGVATGLLGIVATLLTDHSQSLTPADYLRGAELVDRLDRNLYHVGSIAGCFAVLCMLFPAAGWRRWAQDVAPASLPAGVVWLALTATAGAMMLGYGFKGSFAVYLPGGMDAGSMPREGLYAV